MWGSHHLREGGTCSPPAPGVGPPGRQAPPSEFPLCLGLGQTRRLESQAVSGYRSPGCWQVTPGTGLAAGSVPWAFPSAAPLALPSQGTPGAGGSLAQPRWRGLPGGGYCRFLGGSARRPWGPGARRACILTQQEAEGLVLGCGQLKSQQEPRAPIYATDGPRPANEAPGPAPRQTGRGERAGPPCWPGCPPALTRSRCCSSAELTPPLAPARAAPLPLSSRPPPPHPGPIRPSLVCPRGGVGAACQSQRWRRAGPGPLACAALGTGWDVGGRGQPDVRPSAGDTLGAGVGGLWAQWTQLLPVHRVARPLDAIPPEAVRARRLPFPRGWEVTPGPPTFPQGLRLPAGGNRQRVLEFVSAQRQEDISRALITGPNRRAVGGYRS